MKNKIMSLFMGLMLLGGLLSVSTSFADPMTLDAHAALLGTIEKSIIDVQKTLKSDLSSCWLSMFTSCKANATERALNSFSDIQAAIENLPTTFSSGEVNLLKTKLLEDTKNLTETTNDLIASSQSGEGTILRLSDNLKSTLSNHKKATNDVLNAFNKIQEEIDNIEWWCNFKYVGISYFAKSCTKTAGIQKITQEISELRASVAGRLKEDTSNPFLNELLKKVDATKAELVKMLKARTK